MPGGRNFSPVRSSKGHYPCSNSNNQKYNRYNVIHPFLVPFWLQAKIYNTNINSCPFDSKNRYQRTTMSMKVDREHVIRPYMVRWLLLCIGCHGSLNLTHFPSSQTLPALLYLEVRFCCLSRGVHQAWIDQRYTSYVYRWNWLKRIGCQQHGHRCETGSVGGFGANSYMITYVSLKL